MDRNAHAGEFPGGVLPVPFAAPFRPRPDPYDAALQAAERNARTDDPVAAARLAAEHTWRRQERARVKQRLAAKKAAADDRLSAYIAAAAALRPAEDTAYAPLPPQADLVRTRLRAASYVEGGADILATLQHADADGSGTIDAGELRHLVRHSLRITEAQMSDAAVFELMRNLDVTGDGTVDAVEVLAFLTAPGADLQSPRFERKATPRGVDFEEMAAMVCALADRGTVNGACSVNELEVFLSATHFVPFKEWLLGDGRKRFKRFDTDDSQAIEPPELAAALREFYNDREADDAECHAAMEACRDAARAQEAADAELERRARRESRFKARQVRQAAEAAAAAHVEPEVLERMRLKLQAGAYAIGGADYAALFRRADKDGSGEIDLGEWRAIVRKTMKVPPRVASDLEVDSVFRYLDGDSSGEISLAEVVAWLNGDGPLVVNAARAWRRRDDPPVLPVPSHLAPKWDAVVPEADWRPSTTLISSVRWRDEARTKAKRAAARKKSRRTVVDGKPPRSPRSAYGDSMGDDGSMAAPPTFETDGGGGGGGMEGGLLADDASSLATGTVATGFSRRSVCPLPPISRDKQARLRERWLGR